MNTRLFKNTLKLRNYVKLLLKWLFQYFKLVITNKSELIQ